MNFTPLLEADTAVQVHVGFAVVSLALVPVMLLRRKGDGLHKILGRIWVFAMALTALSSFALMEIRVIGPFSPIHGLSILTLYSLFAAISTVRKGDIKAHKKHICGAMGGLVGAGAFTVIPGRLMSDVLFQGIEMLGFISVLGLGSAGLLIWLLKMRAAAQGKLA